MLFSLNNPDNRVANAVQLEDLRDVLFSIFYEAIMRLTGCQVERTGFETALIYQLQLAFLRTVNKIVRRMH